MATRVGELKKPTVSAWAVNQLARARELDMQRLVKAGGALERAQRDAMSGGEAGDFQAARQEEGAAIRRLVDAAETTLPSASRSILDRVAKTLRAAAATSDGRDLVKAGRLAEDLEPPGFEALSGPTQPRSARRGGKSENGRRRQRQGRIDTLRKNKREAEDQTKRTAAEAKQLERQAREADQIATKANRLAAAARKRADAAADKARRFKDELTELERRDR